MRLKPFCCPAPKARVYGRALNEFLGDSPAKAKFGVFGHKHWVPFCTVCERYVVVHGKEQLPYQTDLGFFATASDITPCSSDHVDPALTFAYLRFTPDALKSAVRRERNQEERKGLVEIKRVGSDLARAIRAHGTTRRLEVMGYSEMVCTMSGGRRVWASLMKHHSPEDMQMALQNWLGLALSCRSPAEAIEGGCQIKGMGANVASKHLALIAPRHFPAMDEGITAGLGFAANPRGYQFFCQSIDSLKASSEWDLKMSAFDISTGLAHMARQTARAKDPNKL